MNSNTNMPDADNDCSLDEAFLMYGVQREENENQDDNSIISSDNSETLDERLNSQLFIVVPRWKERFYLSFPLKSQIALLTISLKAIQEVECHVWNFDQCYNRFQRIRFLSVTMFGYADV